MTQEELRTLLRERLEREKQCYICRVTGVDKSTLSMFNTGRLAELTPINFNRLHKYLVGDANETK